jgi:nitrogenase molybdenum-iron protein beta chain
MSVNIEVDKYVTKRSIDHCAAFGAFRAFYGVNDAIVFFNSPFGCAFQIALTFTRHARRWPSIFSSLVMQPDLIFGTEEKVKEGLRVCYNSVKPSVIGLIACCVSDTIGTDLARVASEVQQEIPAKIIAVEGTAGYKGDHVDGYNQATLRILDELVKESKEKIPKSVNLLGLVSDERMTMGDVIEVKRLLNKLGIKVICPMTHYTNVDEIASSSKAELNIVLNEEYGLKAAEFMQKRFGIPYIATLPPAGLDGTSEWIRKVAEHFGLLDKAEEIIREETIETYQRVYIGSLYAAGRNVAIVADPSTAVALTQLTAELGMIPKIIALKSTGTLSLDHIKTLAKRYDFSPRVMVKPDYYELEEAIKSSNIEVIFGSTYEHWLARKLKIIDFAVTYPISHSLPIFEAGIFGYKNLRYWAQRIGDVFAPEYLFAETIDGRYHI